MYFGLEVSGGVLNYSPNVQPNDLSCNFDNGMQSVVKLMRIYNLMHICSCIGFMCVQLMDIFD